MGRRKIPVKELITHIKVQMLAEHYPAGTKLPSIRRLAGKFDLKYQTARQAILGLADAGLLDRAKAGFSVRQWRPEGVRGGIPIAVVVESSPRGATLFHEMLCGMLDSAREWNFCFHFFRFGKTEVTRERLADCCHDVAGAVLLVNCDAALPGLSLPVPAVGTMFKRPNDRISTVNIDEEEAADRAVGYFRQRHVSRVRLFSVPSEAFLLRMECFARKFTARGGAIAGLEIGKIPRLTAVEPHTGYLFASDHQAYFVMDRFREESGLWLPDLAPVLGIDGKRLLNERFGRFSTVPFDWQLAGELALAELHRLIHQPDAASVGLLIPSGKICN